MEDGKIIELYFERSQSAVTETQNKYGRFCYYIAYNILYSEPDAEECVNDTYLKVWNCIPPEKPVRFKCFIGRITRNLALNRYDYNNAKKRSPKFEAAAEEFYECAEGKAAFDDEVILKEIINRFLALLSEKYRVVFIQRYWYFCTVGEIASCTGIKENNVKTILHRARERFKDYLIKEGVLK